MRELKNGWNRSLSLLNGVEGVWVIEMEQCRDGIYLILKEVNWILLTSTHFRRALEHWQDEHLKANLIAHARHHVKLDEVNSICHTQRELIDILLWERREFSKLHGKRSNVPWMKSLRILWIFNGLCIEYIHLVDQTLKVCNRRNSSPTITRI